MNRLIDDWFVRRIAQVLLITFSVVLCGICACFIAIALAAFYGRVSVEDYFIYQFMKALQFSYQNDASPFLTAIVGTLPILVTSVCYGIDTSQSPTKSSENLNFTGRLFFLLLLAGLVLSVAAIFVLQALYQTVNNLIPIKDHSPKSVFTAIISFEAMYLVQLLGLKPK